MDWRAKVELFEEIRREYEFGIGTIAGVAKKLKVHRRMVREAIGSALPAPRKKTERPRWKLAGARGVRGRDSGVGSEGAAEAAPHRTPDLGADASGDAGVLGLRADGSAVRPGAQDALGLVVNEVFVPQSYDWGVEAQVDWYEAVRRSGWRTDQAAGVLDAEYGQRRSVSLRLPARHAAGVPGSA